MKTVQDAPADVGVLVGRFQVPALHEAHIELIKHVCDAHSKVIIFLGLAPTKATKNNPLDFESRKQMILEKFPKVNVLYIKDTKSNELWSQRLDQQIIDLIGPTHTVMLYGSRDSFISLYGGKFPTTELLQERYVSGTDIRKTISRPVMNTPEFRAGVIWATNNQFTKVYPTVDIAILSEDNKRLLLGRKEEEERYRFVGGFAEPKSACYEDDAKREVMEETNVEISEPKYIGSFYIEDWRYRAEDDKIKTLFFKSTYIFGRPTPGDDIAELRWFDLDKIKNEDIVVGHQSLLEVLKKNLVREASEKRVNDFLDN